MHLLLMSLGTRGDIQPFVALGKALQRSRHEVTLCTSSGFEPWIREHGLGYAHLNNDILDLVNSEAGREAMEQTGGLLGLPKRMIDASRRFKSIFRRALAEEWEAAQGIDAVIYNPGAVGGYHIAQALGVKGILADVIPTWVPRAHSPTSSCPTPGSVADTTGLLIS
jgi:sterol 3beta-glucosyltransferase